MLRRVLNLLTPRRRPELTVLFVCTANVCRSPLAEAMLRHRLMEAGLGRKIHVHSAGSRIGQSGRAPDPRVRKLADRAGIPLGRIHARQLTPAMVRDSDYVLVMEPRHREDISAMKGMGTLPDTVQLLGFYSPGGSQPEAIPDPYFGNWDGFEKTFERIYLALDGLIKDLQVRVNS